MLKEEFKYYLENQEELVKKYNGRYIVIMNKEVVDDYKTLLEAYLKSKEKYGLGNFLIQHCTPGKESYTIKLNTPRAILSE